MPPGTFPQQSNLAEELLSLRPPANPCRRVPRVLARLMPAPLESLGHWSRFVGDDLPTLSIEERRLEALRLRTAAALVDVELVPEWVVRRLELLGA